MAWVLIVPGRSDVQFLDGLRRRGLLPNVKRVEAAGTDERVNREAIATQRIWTMRGYDVLFIRDVELSPTGVPPCNRQLLDRFDRKIVADRRVVLARTTIESWFLADQDAVNQLLPKANWKAPAITDGLTNPQRDLTALIRRHSGNPHAEYVKPDFAAKLAEVYDPARATPRSPSLARLLARL